MPDNPRDPKPRFPIRRFDVFAEYNRVKNVADGLPEPIAKGRALWVAKVVASRGSGSVPKAEVRGERGPGEERVAEQREGFRSIGGIPQTDAMFDKEIVDRMGPEFYCEVFQPAVDAAYREGKQYTDIRDTIRKTWK